MGPALVERTSAGACELGVGVSDVTLGEGLGEVCMYCRGEGEGEGLVWAEGEGIGDEMGGDWRRGGDKKKSTIC